MSNLRQAVGRHGEDMAAQYLVSKGWQLIARNWRTRQGELDIIANDGLQLIFVEVRTTTSQQYGLGLESVDRRKQQQVRRVALAFIQQHRYDHLPVRFDVISVLLSKDAEFIDLQHLEGVF